MNKLLFRYSITLDCFVLLSLGTFNLAAQEYATSAVTVSKPAVDEFMAAQAWELGIVKTNDIARHATAPAFSLDNKQIAYFLPDAQTIEIKTLQDMATRHTYKVAGSVESMGWSPDGKRIFCAMTQKAPKILELQAGKEIELPVKYLQGDISWLDEKYVLIGGVLLDLDDLTLLGIRDQPLEGGTTLSSKLEARKASLQETHPNCELECDRLAINMAGDGIFTELFVKSTRRPYRQCIKLSLHGFKKDLWLYSWTSDLKYIAHTRLEYSSTKRDFDHNLSILVLGKATPVAVDIALGNFRGTDNPKAEFGRDLSVGRPVTAEVFAPKTNPLNGKVVGPIGDKKADGDIQVRGGQLIFCTTTQLLPINEGDVACNFESLSPSRGTGSPYNAGIWAELGKAATNTAATVSESPNALRPDGHDVSASRRNDPSVLVQNVSPSLQQHSVWPVIRKAVEARGGFDALLKARSTRTRTRGRTVIGGQGWCNLEMTIFRQYPGLFRQDIKVDLKNRMLTQSLGVMGENCWKSENGKQVRFNSSKTKDLLIHEAFMQDVENLRSILDGTYSIESFEPAGVNGRKYNMVTVAAKDGFKVSLDFDPDTGLLSQRKFSKQNEQGKVIHAEAVYTNYKDHDGLKFPSRSIGSEDGSPIQELEIVQWEVVESMPESFFNGQ